jgi:DNA repair protein RadC
MSTNLSIKNWAEEDRPREKMRLKGRHVLSDSEIIAILLGSGTRTKSAVELAKEILGEFNNDLHLLGKAHVENLLRFNGIGEAKAITLLAALELGRRRKENERPKIVRITSAGDAFVLLQPVFMDLQHEEFHVLFLNQSNVVIASEQVSKGGVTGTIADGKIIFKKALLHQACGIILAHNHPSGALKASEADLKLTKNYRSFGEMIGIEVLDHLIFADNSYLSFADSNML